MELTNETIKGAKAGTILRDATIKGLHLKVTATKKVFMLYFRTKGGMERRPKLGDYGVITLDQARKLAKAMLYKVSAGEDPMFDRNLERDAPTMQSLWDSYWEDHAKGKRSGNEDKRLWTRIVAPKLKDKRLTHVTYEDINKLHKAMADTPYQANRVLALLTTMFNFANKPKKWLSDNPCESVKRYPEVKRKRLMMKDEAQAIAQALLKRWDSDRPGVAFILLLVFCGCRKQDIANAKWSMIADNILRLPTSKTGSKDIYLPPQALHIIGQLPKTSGTLTGIKDPKKLWEAIRKEAGCPDLRMHDLRRTFISAGLAAGHTLDQLGKTVEHASTATTAGYAWLVSDVKEAVTNDTANVLEAMLKLPAPAHGTIQDLLQ